MVDAGTTMEYEQYDRKENAVYFNTTITAGTREYLRVRVWIVVIAITKMTVILRYLYTPRKM
jgi:hypothetical protein